MKVAVIYNKKMHSESDVINIFGPQTKEHYNPKTVEIVASALEKGGHNVRTIEGNIHLADQLRDFMPKVISGEKPGIVFNMAYGIQGQSRYTHIPAMLEMLGVPYVGSGPQAHAVALDKITTKIILQSRRLPTPAFWFFNNPEEDVSEVAYPVIVKPKMEAVSMGLKIVDNPDDLREAIKFVNETYQQEALVEAFVAGREFAVGLLGNGAEVEVLPIVEIDLGGNPNAIQTEDAKKHTPHEKLCPAPLSEEQTRNMGNLAKGAFQALGISDFARVDFRMDAQGNIFILELNSMASLGKTGSYVFAAGKAGYKMDALINRMLDVAAVRYFGQQHMIEPDQKTSQSQPLRVRLRTYLRTQISTLAEHLEELVDIPSSPFNPEDVNLVSSWMAEKFRQLGFQKQVFPNTEVGNTVYLTNHDEPQNDILFLAYLDTSETTIANAAFGDSFREERGRLYGPGAAENKGGLVALLGTFQALRYTRRLKKSRCGILLIPDESLEAKFSARLIKELAGRSKRVLGLRGSDTTGAVTTSCLGSAVFTVELSRAKSKEAPKAGPGDAATAISQKVIALAKLANPQTGINIKVTNLEATGTGFGAASKAKMRFRLSFPEMGTLTSLEEELRKVLRKGIEQRFNVKIRKGTVCPPVPESEANKEFYRWLVPMAERLETKIDHVHASLPSPTCHVPVGTPVLEGLGPLGGGIRTPGEFVLRDGIIDRSALLALIVYNATQERQP